MPERKRPNRSAASRKANRLAKKAPPVRESLKSKEEQGRERRKSSRLGINAVTRYFSDGEEYVGVTKLINLGGLLLEVGEPLSLGSQVSMEMNLPNSIITFRAKGEVVYRNLIRGRLAHVAGEMGVRFTLLEEGCEAMLLDFTKRYDDFDTKHTVFSKEMTTFHDPSIIEANKDSSEELP